jgi:hypothetical protein
MKILYITYENVYRTGILQAMVVKPLAIMHQKYGVEFTIISTIKESEDDEIYFENKNLTSRKYPYLKIIEFKKGLGKSQSIFSFLKDILPIFLCSLRVGREVDLIHCRSYGAALIGLLVKIILRKKFIFDMRGLLPEETVELGKLNYNSFKYRLLKFIEKILIRKADYVFVVSNKFKDYIEDNFKYKHVINVNNPTDFNDYGGIKQYDCINFIYSGSLQKWHLPEKTILYYSLLSKIYKENIHLYFCTNDIDKAKRYFEDGSIAPRYYTLQSVPFEKMPYFYAKSHIGFCFINESFSKSVCFPVKFSEYIASNIYVLANENIGDLKEIISKYDCGLVFNDLENIETNLAQIDSLVSRLIREKVNFDRNKIDFLDWNVIGTENIYKIYEKLCS